MHLSWNSQRKSLAVLQQKAGTKDTLDKNSWEASCNSRKVSLPTASLAPSPWMQDGRSRKDGIDSHRTGKRKHVAKPCEFGSSALTETL